MTVKEDLQAARDLISDPTHWCQGKASLNDKGDWVDPSSSEAVSFCLVGAATHIASGDTSRLLACWNTMKSDTIPSLTYFNDTHTHAEVLYFLDQRIASLSEGV